MKKLPILLTAALATSVNAMNVDTMLLVGDEYGNGVFTLTNSNKITEFIQSNITQLVVEDGKITRVPYSEDNFEDWHVTLTHNKTILEPNRQKQIGVRSLCGNKCDFTEDQYYLVSFEPSPYDPEGKLNSAVTINFGYRPLFVIPAQVQDIDYSISLDQGQLHINNTGNSFVRAYIDQCTDEVTEDCEVTIMSLAGRKRNYPLPENIDLSDLKVTVVNHDESYRQDETLSENK
ncbi:Pilus assembly protein [Vibrio crassostreae]|nr:Pilus assembly protein [Vibrio crassostreae]CAK2914754.1 Pilus assembly protein [Vibrio crassostreae]CAK2944315.1 Pilus assembly protein [Vibrio crassostreae]CAK2945375.1 Pilus assembly protein [Vibrio crassostreae]CAK2949876.1 Pilus assembly protein [Vibrio crassostreae]